MCHVANLALAAGIFLNRPILSQAATLWLVTGLPLWFFESAIVGDWRLVSILSHLGGATLGLAVVAKNGACRGSWILAFALMGVLQPLSRLVTPRDLNVNLGFAVHDSSRWLFSSYLSYWIVFIAALTLAQWLLEKLLLAFFPVKGESAQKGNSHGNCRDFKTS